MIQQIKLLILGRSKEKGAVLVLAILVMAFIIALIPAMVSFMNAGAKSGIVYEERNDELYSADAGVQDALVRIKNTDFSSSVDLINYQTTYNFHEAYDDNVNEKTAQVTISTISKGDGILYFKVFSEGQSASGKETTVTAYVNAFGGWLLSDHAYTSPEYLAFHPGDEIHGGAQLPSGWNNKGDIDNVSNEPILGWPTAGFFADHYIQQVDTVSDYKSDGTVITVPQNGNLNQGDIYCNGTLTINAQGGESGSRLDLSPNSTWYIKGDLNINRPNNKGLVTINLNNSAIFLEGNFSQDTLSGLKQIDIRGPGVIVAVGDITFAPAADATGSAPIYILSIEGAVDMWPRGDFYGSITSREAAKVQPNTKIYYPSSFDWGSLNLPTESDYDTIIGNIESWEIDNPFTGIKIGPYVLPLAEAGQHYSQTLQATPVSTYIWSVASSSVLPGGLSFSTGGILSGYPTTAGKYYFTVEAKDQSSGDIGKQVIAITVRPLLTVTANLPDDVAVGEFYDGRIVTNGGVPPFEWKITSGSLPEGLTLNEFTGQISGTPTTAGAYPVSGTVEDFYNVTKDWDITITIN